MIHITTPQIAREAMSEFVLREVGLWYAKRLRIPIEDELNKYRRQMRAVIELQDIFEMQNHYVL